MDFLATEFVRVLYALLPGFFASWIFYGLTAHPKQTPFERVVQALIFTAIVRFFVVPTRWLLFLFGNLLPLGHWTSDTEFIWSMLFATAIGFIFTYFANNDQIHVFLRNLSFFNGKIKDITKRTSYPSEWFSAFNKDRRFVVLHLKDNRRVQGWPYEWPDSPDTGHFVLMNASWLLPDNTQAHLYSVERMLIPAAEVEIVEVLANESELRVTDDDLKEAYSPLIKLQKEDNAQNSQDSQF
ncbi:hypothetical protein DTL42_11920 [Bremerella cremea]|uniref:Uncharacterized protein n=1 Tax=Bremerella cremea TaxID=1031537 RepID=A0A368KQT2_9BACT|nr:DUF6338 family protein [Bremerella cremea]RCS49238.1 hypothetical protein DTL42_11920 [Bremerella cremea]